MLGIGGSSLGPEVIYRALRKRHKPNIYIYDNVDPSTLDTILRHIELKKTVVNVITKSGTTAETVASFMVIWDLMKKEGLKPEEHFVVTTDPERGPLRRLVREYNLISLSIPHGVVGRYSVLSPVGLLIAKVMGIEIEELLSGARSIIETLKPNIWNSPCYLFGSMLYLMDIHHNKNINVIMPYTDSLRVLSQWFAQLWAESLGKENKGLMPYPSKGTVDQHSQLQYWMEGPGREVIIFIRVEDFGVDIKIPDVFPEYSEFRYLSGHTLSELIKIEQESTMLSLRKRGRPSMTLSIPSVDAYNLGKLFNFLQIATAFTGLLYGINPFNQPAVEDGKIYTRAILGMDGFEKEKKEVETLRRISGWFLRF